MKTKTNKTISRKKQTIVNLIANIVSYAVSIGISFVLTPFLISNIGKDTYSFYPIANTFLNYMVVITSALNTIASRFITVHFVRGEEQEAKKYFHAAFLSESVVGITLMIPMIIIVVFIDKFLDVPINYLSAIRILFATIFASGLTNIVSSTLGVATFTKNRIDLRSYRELAASILRGALCIAAYSLFPVSIAYIGIIALAVAIFNVVIQFFYTKKLLPGFLFNKEKPSKSHFIILIKGCIWTIVISLGDLLLGGSTTVMANIFYGSTASGTFSLVHTIPSFLSGIITLLIGVFYPHITYSVAENNKEELEKIILLAEKVVGGFGACVISVFMGAAMQFYAMWVSGEDFVELFYLSFLSMGSYIPAFSFWALHHLFIAEGKVKIPGIVTIIFGFVNIGIMSLLGVLKAPYWTLLFSSFLMHSAWTAIFMPIYAHKLTNISYKKIYSPFVLCLLFAVVCFGFCYSITKIIAINSWLKFAMYGLILGGLSLVSMFYLLDKKMFINYVKLVLKKINVFGKKQNSKQ